MPQTIKPQSTCLKTLMAMVFRRRPDPHGEHLAATWLRLQGLRLLARNYACPQGEIDLIMRDKKTLVFVEVKYRTQQEQALWSINRAKQTRIMRAAAVFLSKNPHLAYCPMRFDAVTIERAKTSFIPVVKWYACVFEDTT